MGNSNSHFNEWRRTIITSWDEHMKNNLKKRIREATHAGKKVLLFGRSGNGKSSFINSVFSAIENERRTRATICADTACRTTRKMRPYELKADRWNMTLYDMEGLSLIEEQENVTVGCLKKILTDLEWDPKATDTSVVEGDLDKGSGLKIDALVVVAEYTANFDLQAGSWGFGIIKEVIQLYNQSGVPAFLLITKIDEAKQKQCFELKNIHSDAVFEAAVQSASKEYGIPEEHVLLQSNYHGPDHTMKTEIDILTLYNLWFVLSNISSPSH